MSDPPSPSRRPPEIDYRAYSIRRSAALKPLRQGVTALLARALFRVGRYLPLSLLQRIGRSIGRLAYRLSKRQRNLALAQLAFALPDLSDAERQHIARMCFCHQGMTLLETMALPRLRHDPGPWMRLENSAALTDAHALGRGVILVTAHVGNWELIGAFLQRLRIRLLAVASTHSNPRINRMINEIRNFEYMEIAERGSNTSPRQMLSYLKRGDALMMVNDVDIDAQGVFVDFFGIPANTPRAPASLALKLDAPVVTYFDARQPDGSHVVTFDSVPITPDIRGADDPVKVLTQAITARTEAHIRRHPEQWAWNHRRWKRRPTDAGRPPGGVPTSSC